MWLKSFELKNRILLEIKCVKQRINATTNIFWLDLKGHISCDLDPIPTSLVLDCISVLMTPITNIVNYSLQEGSFPSCFKTAHVTPLLKKAGLDRNILKNYRPVSNLSYISKLIEKAVVGR